MMTNKSTRVAAVVVLILAGCGGGGLDRTDPEAVVKALVQSYAHCGAEGAGRRAELVYPESAQAEEREKVAEEEAPGGCQPASEVDVITAIVPSREPGIPLVVEVSGGGCAQTEVPMIEVDGQWYIDASEIMIGLICTPYG